jgi:outer membrane protein assembly factor BamB
VGTNNASPRDPRITGDYSVLLCLDEKTGAMIWQLLVPKTGSGKVGDWEYLGISSSPAIDGERLYIVTTRCEVMCLDVQGLANGNQGVQDEATYSSETGKPVEVTPTMADILWRFDMAKECGVFPHNTTSGSPLVIGDRVYINTSNGVDWSHINIPHPRAPTLVVLDKNTGELVGEEASGISERMFHSNWASPSYGEVNGQGMIFFGAGDGFTYAFDPVPVKGEDGLNVLREIWRFDCNPPHHRMREGKPIKYATAPGPSEIIATPVFVDGRVYIGVGQDPEHGEGVGNLSCIDASKTGDITQTGKVWTFEHIGRTMSTVCVADGLVYAAEYAGKLHCLDAATGALVWTHDTLAHIWGSPLVADGKVYLGNEDGFVTVLKHGRDKRVLAEIELPAPVYGTPVVANGVLYVMCQTHLFAVAAN